MVKTHQQDHIMNEKSTMMMLHHPFLVHLYATYKSQKCLYFLMEPVLGGELFAVLRKNSTFSPRTARFYAACVTLALDYMHCKGLVYRDLKPENLLLDKDGYLKITDFGFAKKIDDGKTFTVCGIYIYIFIHDE